MALNLADNLSPAIWWAPLAAPIGSLPMLSFSEGSFIGGAISFSLLAIMISCLVIVLVVAPIFLLTRKRIVWRPTSVVCLGGGLAVSPFAVGHLWGFADALVRRAGADYIDMVLNQDWRPFWAMLICGIAVALAFVVCQTRYQNRVEYRRRAFEKWREEIRARARL